MLDRIRHEPAVLLTLLGSLIALGTAFGLDLSAEQVGAIMAAVSAVLGLVIRSQVTPTTPLDAAHRRN